MPVWHLCLSFSNSLLYSVLAAAAAAAAAVAAVAAAAAAAFDCASLQVMLLTSQGRIARVNQ